MSQIIDLLKCDDNVLNRCHGDPFNSIEIFQEISHAILEVSDNPLQAQRLTVDFDVLNKYRMALCSMHNAIQASGNKEFNFSDIECSSICIDKKLYWNERSAFVVADNSGVPSIEVYIIDETAVPRSVGISLYRGNVMTAFHSSGIYKYISGSMDEGLITGEDAATLYFALAGQEPGEPDSLGVVSQSILKSISITMEAVNCILSHQM